MTQQSVIAIEYQHESRRGAPLGWTHSDTTVLADVPRALEYAAVSSVDDAGPREGTIYLVSLARNRVLVFADGHELIGDDAYTPNDIDYAAHVRELDDDSRPLYLELLADGAEDREDQEWLDALWSQSAFQ